jgi:dTDP-4-dehydrorhamnose reductase
MKTVLVLGATGMLGHQVARTLAEKGHDVLIAGRDGDRMLEFDFGNNFPKFEFNAEKVLADVLEKKNSYFQGFVNRVGPVDYVVNAVGVTIPFALQNTTATLFVNGAFPHLLAREYGERLIHITTDCVYSGTDKKAPYDEDSPKSAHDLYGLSKSLGEPHNCLTIRTSIIGPEMGRSTGLLGWFLEAAKSGSVNGYKDHLWNGITTKQFALACDKVISNGHHPQGVYHVHSNAVSKYEMLLAFKKKFHLKKCDIVPMTSSYPVDRRLASIYHFNTWLKIPTFQQMIDEM